MGSDGGVLRRLSKAAIRGDERAIGILVKHHARPGLRLPDGRTPLMLACANERVGCARMLLPISNAAAASRDGWTALMIAAEAGSEPCVEMLLAAGGPLAADQRGETALMKAAKRGRLGCAKMLLPASNARAADHHGQTALMHAIEAGDPDCVELLLPASDPLAVDKHGRAAMEMAIRNVHRGCDPRREECAMLLAQAGWLGHGEPKAEILVWAQRRGPADFHARLEAAAERGELARSASPAERASGSAMRI